MTPDNDDTWRGAWGYVIAYHNDGTSWRAYGGADCDGPGGEVPHVTVTRRADDWHACVTGQSGLWEAGRSFHAAIGALAVSLGLVRVDE